ncbi:M55 family metallopeptidase [Melittangium boletus]|uniref:Peptidase M55 n=1 Tax=Melittangium boletus DSM 14713 TaxID=1294270 RepID=A0A250IGS0_9BACT|nr:M55 family metallopeptidase [Melittangium boletus]ATB30468.1 hypothetical protein MEBOL_003929 [Melittangium boletus DSM 14713]
MARALIIVDLEGVAGVDALGAVIAGAPGYSRARERVTAEVNALVEGLLAAGFEHVRVSDSHLSGSGGANLLTEALHPAVELHFLAEDAYAAPLFADVQAVACVGMHAAAGSGGFGAHTVDLLGHWTCAGRALSETDLVLGLAAEVGVPGLLVSGDDVLCDSLGGRVSGVCTKTALSLTEARSRPSEAVCAQLRLAAARPARPLEPVPEAPLVLTFKSQHQAGLAARTGARRAGPYRVEVEGATFRERYTRALRASAAAASVLTHAVAGGPGDASFSRDALALFHLPGPPALAPPPPVAEAERALEAFLASTAGTDDVSRALRALTLHMLEGHAPRVFSRWGLEPTLQTAGAALAEISLSLPVGLAPEEAMARIDAWFVRRERGFSTAPLAPSSLRAYLERAGGEGQGLYAWLLGEMVAACGIDVRLSIPERAYRDVSRVADLYWLTHLYLLDSRYLRIPVRSPDAVAWTEELLAAAPWVREQGLVDLAAEVVFCLQCVEESGGGAHASLLSLLIERQDARGGLGDAHATAAALLALAGACERARGFH